MSGCGLLVGNVKPVDEKSEDYRVLDLRNHNSDWTRLEPAAANPNIDKGEAKDTFSSEVSDVSYQSKKTASIISLNSACRGSRASEEQSLKEFSQQLLLGMTNVTQRVEKEIQVQQVPALETTVEGKLNGEHVAIRTVVLKKDECVYDLMFVARPEHFPTQEPDFTRFVSSLKLK